jgi:hypothetical protein
MAATKSSIAPDSAAELHALIGDDATATFENDPNFIDSDATGTASSENVEVQRDTDDTEDSEEEDDELEDEELEEEDEEDDEDLEDEDEDDDLDEEDEDEEDEEEDDEEEVGASAAERVGRRGSVEDVADDAELEEDDDSGDEGEMEDEYVIESGGEGESGDDLPETDRAIDAALRMKSMLAGMAEFAARV